MFVTRFKRNAALKVLNVNKSIDAKEAPILTDERVLLTNRHPGGKRRNQYDVALRRVTVAREGKTPLVLATNDFKRSAAEIAELYKARWQIELFFQMVEA